MIKYYVVPEKKKVIAVLNNCEYDVMNKIDKMMNNMDFFCVKSRYAMPHQFRAVAICCDDDEFDVETGKRVAKSKLMKKYYKKFDEKMSMFSKDLDEFNSKVADYITKNSSGNP